MPEALASQGMLQAFSHCHLFCAGLALDVLAMIADVGKKPTGSFEEQVYYSLVLKSTQQA